MSSVKISVFGLGYVGMVTAACLAADGHEVIGVDVNRRKVDQVKRGVPTVGEPGLADRVRRSVDEGRLTATDDVDAAISNSECSLICVGTPSNANGSLDTRYVERVCAQIGDALRSSAHDHVVVIRSTVLPGTTLKCLAPILRERSGRSEGSSAEGRPALGIAVNPEFLREGSAIKDFFESSLVVIGSDDGSGERVASMYASLEAEIVQTSVTAAEMVKYANNAFHALKITFANEIGTVAKANGVDGRQVMDIVAKDTRLNVSSAYLRPGFAYGGSCLPKDMRALLHRAKELDVETPMLSAIPFSNERHVDRAVRVVESFGRRNVGVLGLSFKAGTDDLRESPSIPLIETLVGRGYSVTVFDDAVDPESLFGANREYVERELPHIASIMRATLDDVLQEADVVVVANGNPSFRSLPERIRPDQILVDLVGAVGPSETTRGPTTSICW